MDDESPCSWKTCATGETKWGHCRRNSADVRAGRPQEPRSVGSLPLQVNTSFICFVVLTRNRFHPAIQRVKEIIDNGELGGVKEIHVSLCFPKGIISDGDIRLDYSIGGGIMMDAGCKSWLFLSSYIYKLSPRLYGSLCPLSCIQRPNCYCLCRNHEVFQRPTH